MPSAPSSIFSRILFLLSGAVVIGMAAWFIQTSLAPVPAPPFVPPRKSVSFDANLDVSKNETFFRLRPLGPMVNTQPQMLGRANPFDPAPPPAPTIKSTPIGVPRNPFKSLFAKIAPDFVILEEIPSDAFAKKVAHRWKTKNQTAPLSILSFGEPPEQKVLLEEKREIYSRFFRITEPY